MLQSKNQNAISEYQKVEQELTNLKSQYSHETNIIKKERLLKQIKTLEEVKPPKIENQKFHEFQLKIEELQLADKIKNLEKQSEMEKKYLESLPAKTKVTGFITRIILSNPPQAIRSGHYPKDTPCVVSFG